MFYSAETLGPKQSLLPSGTLLCRDAPIARVGMQLYHVAELPDAADAATPDDDGMIEVLREPDQVFDPDAMASFQAVPITMGHPDDPVGPDNWRDLSVGHVANIRRDGDFLVGDLLIHDQRGIRAVRDLGWRALSAGYDARYRSTGNGGLRQTDVVGNHVALLPPHQDARCGPRCAIGDSASRPRAARPGLMRTHDQWSQPSPRSYGGSGADTVEADPRDPSATGIIGAQESFGPPGIEMHRRRAQAIAAADAIRSRTALRSINEANKAYWGTR